MIRTQHIIHMSHEICVNKVYAIGEASVNGRLLVVKFSGNSKLYMDFRLCEELPPPTPTSFQGQPIHHQNSYIRKMLLMVSATALDCLG